VGRLGHEWTRVSVTSGEGQRQLDRWVKESGEACVMGPDGVLAVQDEATAPTAIDSLADILFPEGWYRVEIEDRKKARRYRAFVERHDTTVIEEYAQGRRYFIQAIREKLYRHRGIPTHVCYMILRDDLDPDAVSQHLGLKPSFACKKGQPFDHPYLYRRADAPMARSWTGRWELASLEYIECNDVHEHINWLLTRLGPLEQLLLRYKVDSDTRGRIVWLNLVRPLPHTGISIHRGTMLRLCAICDRVEFNPNQDDHL
jgi:hypothetical protein